MSLVAVGLLTSANAADDLSSMFKDGKVSGQLREFSILRNTNYSDTTADFSREANTVGGYLKFDTADYKGLSLGAAFYTTNGFGLPGNSAHIDPTLLGVNKSSYSLLGEAYVQYKYENTTFKGGRQKLDTPLAGSDDARMLPNLFEAYVLTNTDIANTTLLAAHVTQEAAGTFANGYAGGVYGATSGYTFEQSTDVHNTATMQGKFTNMGTWAVGQETKGVSTVAAIYAKGSLKAQVWDYYAYDILNAVYGEASVGWNCLLTDKIKPSLSAQMIKENAIGERFAGDVNSFFGAGKFNVNVGDANIYVAYSEQSKNDKYPGTYPTTTNALQALEKATITPWGGMPAFTQGMVTRNQFIAGTKATKIAGSYDFKNMGANVVASAFYTSFDMDKNSGAGSVRTATEPGFDVAYKPAAVKNLELKFRGNFPRQYSDNANGTNSRDWDEYRFIANYNF